MDAPPLVACVFGQVQVERWDAPLVRLPDRDAARDYLIAPFVALERHRRALWRRSSTRLKSVSQ